MCSYRGLECEVTADEKWIPTWVIDFKAGERGRNRTYNLLIKSQLLCQLSYAPTLHREVGTNLDYTIRIARIFCGQSACEESRSARLVRRLRWS